MRIQVPHLSSGLGFPLSVIVTSVAPMRSTEHAKTITQMREVPRSAPAAWLPRVCVSHMRLPQAAKVTTHAQDRRDI